jgi:threonine synthase
MDAFRMECSGCGATVDAAVTLPFRCPDAVDGDDIDHVLVRSVSEPGAVDAAQRNPFIRYRHRILAYHLALRHGLADADFCGLVEDLDNAVARVDGRGFRVTPFAPVPALAERCGVPPGGALWVKDETANVGGSHKARHLMGVMIYLRVVEHMGLPVADGLRRRRLAIASCGNAALAAAVVARAADWPLDVFIPPDAGEAVTGRLGELGAHCHAVGRAPGQTGDPCFHAFRHAVGNGSLGFGVQGSETGLAIEGGQTMGWEMAEALNQAGTGLDMLFVHVGGGALATACHRGLEEGSIASMPRLFTVQTEGAYPLRRAFERFVAKARPGDLDGALRMAARNRCQFMKPWPEEPKSVAHGILDDETYDWLALVEGMAQTGGDALVAGESSLREANAIAREATGIAVSHTGSAGLAGLVDLFRDGGVKKVTCAVLFTGAER